MVGELPSRCKGQGKHLLRSPSTARLGFMCGFGQFCASLSHVWLECTVCSPGVGLHTVHPHPKCKHFGCGCTWGGWKQWPRQHVSSPLTQSFIGGFRLFGGGVLACLV
jgi:hypothetical protein